MEVSALQVGDLVKVRQELGAMTNARTRKVRERGLGIVLSVEESKPLVWGEFIIPIGKDVSVALITGEVETFSDKSIFSLPC